MLQNLECFFLTPFTEELKPVYYDVVEPCVKEAAIRMDSVKVDVIRADQEVETKEEKVERIRKLIRKADFLIADLTHFNANVMWELGFAQACRKDVILLGQAVNNIPFNIRTHDIIQYENTEDGRARLKQRIELPIRKLLTDLARSQKTCYHSRPAVITFELVKDVFRQHERNSISSVFLDKEIARGHAQFTNLSRGIYEVRKERPASEIVDTYSKILSLLTDGSKFDTLSCADFWLNITDSGNNLDYVNANRTAAQNGAQIRRIFFVDRATYHKGAPDDVDFRSILRRHHQNTQGYTNVQLRIYSSEHYQKDSSRSYRNSALIEHGTERLLLQPTYALDRDSNRMQTTHFYHHDLDPTKVQNNQDNVDMFQRSRANFNALWSESKPLTPDDYN